MSSKKTMQISQEAFDAVVKENMDDFGLELDEALEDAIKTFELQGVDLKGIITDGSGGASINSHPVVQAVKELQDATSGLLESKVQTLNGEGSSIASLSEITRSLDVFCIVCQDGGPESVSIAGRYGGVEAGVSACNAIRSKGIASLCPALKALTALVADAGNRDKFSFCGGPEMLMSLLADNDKVDGVIEDACAIISASSTGDEILKEKFMDLNAVEVLTKLLKEYASEEGPVLAICNAFRSLVTADDDRVIASKAFGNARKFAEKGMVEAILLTCRQQSASSTVVAALCAALKCLAVNEDICKTVAEQEGLSFVLQALDQLAKQENKVLAKNACSLLSQLAGSDDNKDAIVSEGGFGKIIQIMSVYSDDPSVLQETMTAIAVLSLRSPTNAIKAVQAGALEMVAEAMENHPSAVVMQRQACQMLRNLAARSPENRSAILDKGLEVLIRRAKANHANCKDAASAALRDLGFDDYNS